MAEELKPCPFCPDGGKPDVRMDVMRGVINRDEYIPWCERCGTEYTGEKGYFDSEGEAADAWNTRYKRTSHVIIKDECPVCSECNEDIDPSWVACPYCGAEIVDDD